MIRYLFLSLSLIFVNINSFSQVYGDEWVDVTKEYYKVKILDEGFFQIGYQELLDVGFPVDNVDPRNLQLWYRGEESSIIIIGEEDGVFDVADTILFFGRKADSELEKPLYADTSYRVNSSYSLYSDTSYYFLTWDESVLGNRISKSQIGSTVSVVDEFSYKDELLYSLDYSRGEEPIEYVFKSEFDKGEGWMTRPFGYRPTSPNSNFWGVYVNCKGDRNIELQVEFVGRNKNKHNMDISVGEEGKYKYYDINPFEGYESIKQIFLLEDSVREDERVLVRSYAYGDGNNETDLVSIASYNISSKSSELSVSGDYYEFFVDGMDVIQTPVLNEGYVYYDVTNLGEVVELTQEIRGGELLIHSSQKSGNRRIIAVKKNVFLQSIEIKKVKSFANDLTNVNFLILSHEAFWSGAQEYSNYRTTFEGGSYNVLLVDLERVFDQYNYGEKNPIAVKNLIRKLIDNNQKPNYFFIIGDGAGHHNQNGSKPFMRHLPFKATDEAGNLYYNNQDYILTYGDPGWDMGFSAGIEDGNELIPSIPTGRLAAQSNQDVLNYLNKVKEHENNVVDNLWRKRAIHLSGGRDDNEHNQFLNFVNNYSEKFKSEYVGGSVTTYSKKSTDVIEFFNISKEVNKGVGIITYIGHSSPTFIEVDIGTASEDINGYRNKGKYPLMFLNGCSAGDIFSSRSRAQDWLNTADRGAIAAFAHASFGYTGELNRFCSNYYQLAFQDSIYMSKPIGDVQIELMKQYLSSNSGDPVVYTQAQQMFLLGDPSITLFPDTLPDYNTVFASTASFNDERVTAVSDSFQLTLFIENYGRAINDSLSLCITRSNNSKGLTSVYGPLKFPAIYYQDTISLTVYNYEGQDWGGTNDFKVTLNCNGESDQNGLNDVFNYRFVMSQNGVNNVFPKNYSIVGDSAIDFLSQTYELFKDSVEIEMELDTTLNFLDPLYSTTVKSTTEVNFGRVNLPVLVDSIVYYWRTKIATDSVWTLSTFTYIENQKGEGQFDIKQYYSNEIDGVERDLELGRWEFTKNISEVEIKAAGSSAVDYKTKSSLVINGQSLVLEGARGGCFGNGIHITFLDRLTALPYNVYGVDAGNCGQKPRITNSYNSMNNVSKQNQVISNLLAYREGDFVVFQTSGNVYAETWSDSLKDLLKEYGAQQIDLLTNGVPYIMIGEKGGDLIFELLGDDNTSELDETINVNGTGDNAIVKSPLIGPSSHWSNYQDSYVINGSDSVSVSIYGVRSDLTDTLLFTLDNVTKHKIDFDTTVLSALLYPYLKTTMFMFDTVDLSSPQIDFWSVSYDGVPEGSIVLPNDFQFTRVLEEGDEITVPFQFVNISEEDFGDSIEVEFQLIGTNEKQIWTEKHPLLLAGDTLNLSVLFNSLGFSGENKLQVFVNPYIQPEVDYVNNSFEMNLSVIKDYEHPILDVTINNEHIRDGAWVTSTPQINGVLYDNNQILYPSDTANFFVYFGRDCDNCELSRVYFSNEKLTYTSKIGEFNVVYLPGELEDGIYRLRMYAFDLSGNKSSELPYEVSFEVKSTKALVLEGPYPNPSNRDVRFKIDVSGDLPNDIEINIYTYLGKHIRTLTVSDFNRFKIGESGALIIWDGTNQFGAPVMNGEYIYTITGGNGFEWEGEKRGKLVMFR